MAQAAEIQILNPHLLIITTLGTLSLSASSNRQAVIVVLVGLIIVAGVVGFGYYTTSSRLSSLSDQNTNLGQQLSNLNQQDSSLNQQVSSLEQRTISTVTLTNTIVTVETTTSVTTTTKTSISAVPLSTLVVVNDTYNAAAKTFYFVVQDAQNYTVFAQLNAQIGISGCGDNGNTQSYFVSPVYTFYPLKTTTVDFNTTLISSATTCGSSLIPGQVNLNFVIGNGLVASQSYTVFYNP
jgi:hypothetical protein